MVVRSPDDVRAPGRGARSLDDRADVEVIDQQVIDRFLDKIDQTTNHWIWTGGLGDHGYGVFWDGERFIGAHCFSYELFVGPIPNGLVIDHSCRNHACVTPSCMEPVTNRENILRGVGPTAINARKTHCVRGHELVAENLYSSGSGRQCKLCHRERALARKRRLAS